MVTVWIQEVSLIKMPQGTYILITSDGYRVTPLNDYGSLFDGYMPDMSRYLNTDKVVEAFGECRVFKTEAEVIEVARAISKAYQETEDGILSTVSKFANDNHDANKFELATKKISPLNTREFTLAENDYQIPGVGISRQLIRWVYEAKKFDVSTPFRVDDKYVVAMVRQIVPKGVPSVDQIKVELTSAVLKEKKAALLSKKVTAAAAKSIDLLASKLGVQVVQIPGVNFANPYVGNLSRNGEPAVVGAAAGLVKGKLSSPIVGNEGVYVLVVNDVKPVPVKDASQYKIYGSGVGQQIASRIVSGIAKAIVEKANITDNRSTFY